MTEAMKLTIAMAAVGLLLAPLAVRAEDKSDPFRAQLKAQHEARQADLDEHRERQERAAEMKERHDLEHPEMIYDDEEHDDVDDD